MPRIDANKHINEEFSRLIVSSLFANFRADSRLVWYPQSKNKKLINPGFPAAHPDPAYRCFLPDLTGFTGPWLRRTRAHERFIDSSKFRVRSSEWKSFSQFDFALNSVLCTLNYYVMAERVGFEPTLGFPKHAFQACAFGLSATSPTAISVQSTEYMVQRNKDMSSHRIHSVLSTLYSVLIFLLWRRGRDLNPGWSYPHNSFRDCRLQPLGHLSLDFSSKFTVPSSKWNRC